MHKHLHHADIGDDLDMGNPLRSSVLWLLLAIGLVGSVDALIGDVVDLAVLLPARRC